MTTFTFTATGGGEYDGWDGGSLENKTGSGNAYVQGSDDNDISLMLFNSNSIRSALQGYNITACTLSFTVNDANTNPVLLSWGTHNYTSDPNTLALNRTNRDRVRISVSGTGRVTGFNLGTTIGAEFRDGVTTGLTLGGVPSGYSKTSNYAEVAAQDTGGNAPVLTITAVLANTAPNAPTLNQPAAGGVVDATQDIGFNWTHSDPQGDPMSAWYFRRKHTDGTYDYWDGTNFVATETKLTTATVSLTSGLMMVPAGKWASNTAYSWSVATVDPAGLKGPYATDRVLYVSTPPMATVTAPGSGATISQSRPTITWTYSDVDGQQQYGWAAQIVPMSVYSQPGYNPDNYLGTAWTSSGTGTATTAPINKDLLNHTTYRAYVRTSSSPNPSGGLQWSMWSYTEFSVVIPPFAPQITFPANGSIADLATTGFTLSWKDTFFSNIGMQTSFAIRRQVGAGAYQWWNGATWGNTEIFLSGTAPQFVFRAGEVTNGQTYTFAVAIVDDYGQASPYSTGATVTAATVAQVTIIQPSGVTVTTQPVVTWTMYQAENDPQQTYQVKILSADQVVMPPTGAFDPTTVTPVWDSGEMNDVYTRNVQVPIDLQNNTSYVAFVRLKSGGLYTSWDSQAFNIFLVAPATPAISTMAHNDTGIIDVIVQGRDSMLTDVASRSASGWMNMMNIGNATVRNSVFFGSAESHLMVQVTSTQTGTMMAMQMDEAPVQAGFTYTAGVTLLAANGIPAVPSYAAIHWYDANDALIQTSYGQIFTDSSAIRSTVTAVAPMGAVNARMGAYFQNVARVGDIHQFFDPVLRPGTGGEWSPGGLLTNTTVTVSEMNSGRPLRYGTNVPVPVETQQVIVQDEEAAIGVGQMYQANTRAVYPNATLASMMFTSLPVSWTSGFLWLSDPIRPGSGRVFNPQKFDNVVKPTRQGKFRPLGRPDAIMVSGVQGLREGSFTILTYTRAERDNYDDLVMNSQVLLLRMPPDQGEDFGDSLYFATDGSAPQSRPVDNRTTHRTITQNWTEQFRPLDFIDYGENLSQPVPTPAPMPM